MPQLRCRVEHSIIWRGVAAGIAGEADVFGSALLICGARFAQKAATTAGSSALNRRMAKSVYLLNQRAGQSRHCFDGGAPQKVDPTLILG
jgi:hypothetical protein